ncbi:MAG: methylenetetrahydrofolate--tRNA-(uracil(54)-C(5))-methyltransferase (FADH(2)-oxidizing) TrmFO [Clostridia bacterium]|nr:methylenetetrahydrofolate--tRNA-(uracil(54)-C(5))-methyltransferase (FADH(2)-oxidizing) TrmFO [Clostridia bacterium]
MRNKRVTIIGAGLAGSEAALLLSKHGFQVDLYDPKPVELLPAYELDSYAELVCNNSFGLMRGDTPLGLLRCELNFLNSELVHIANACRISDEKYFAIDKKAFSNAVTEALQKNGVRIHEELVETLPKSRPLIVATGPLTGNRLVEDIADRFKISGYHFADASSPVVDITSINLRDSHVVKLSDDLYGVIIPDTVFNAFEHDLSTAKISHEHAVDSPIVQYEKSHSIEQLAKYKDGSLKGRFVHPYFNENILLMRREAALTSGFILVGCMTAMLHSEQKRIFSMLPGFQNCKIIKYGRMHRNTYFDSPQFLDHFYKTKKDDIYIIGQLSGVDGYLPAISSGFIAAYRIINGENALCFPTNTMVGALANYVSNEEVVDFQPMCASFSLLSENYADYKASLKNFIL